MASVLTAKGRDIVAARLIGATPTQAPPIVLAWGVPSAQFTAAVSDVSLFAETTEARVTGTPTQVTTTTTNDTFQTVGTLTAAGTRAVTEVAIMDSTTKPFSTTVAAASTVSGSAVGTGLNLAASYTPANGTLIQIRSEVLSVTSGTTTTALVVVRGANSSTAISTIATGDVVTIGNQPGVSTTTGGTMLAHFDFAVINLANTNTLASTCQVQFS